MTEKICPQCKKPKEICEANFHHNKQTKSGFNPTCKVCANARQKRLRQHPLHLTEDRIPEDKPRYGPFEKQCLEEKRGCHISSGISIFEAV